MHGYAITRTYSTYFRPVVLRVEEGLPLPRSAPHRNRKAGFGRKWGTTEKESRGTPSIRLPPRARAQTRRGAEKLGAGSPMGVARVMRGAVGAEAKVMAVAPTALERSMARPPASRSGTANSPSTYWNESMSYKPEG